MDQFVNNNHANNISFNHRIDVNPELQRYSLGPAQINNNNINNVPRQVMHNHTTMNNMVPLSPASTKRQLPIVTPYGPQPLRRQHQRQLPPMQNIISHQPGEIRSRPPQVVSVAAMQLGAGGRQVAIPMTPGGPVLPAIKHPPVAGVENIPPLPFPPTYTPRLDQDSNLAHSQDPRFHQQLMTRQYHPTPVNNHHSESYGHPTVKHQQKSQQPAHSFRRELPIITKQGVLKLRNVNSSSESDSPARRHRPQFVTAHDGVLADRRLVANRLPMDTSRANKRMLVDRRDSMNDDDNYMGDDYNVDYAEHSRTISTASGSVSESPLDGGPRSDIESTEDDGGGGGNDRDEPMMNADSPKSELERPSDESPTRDAAPLTEVTDSERLNNDESCDYTGLADADGQEYLVTDGGGSVDDMSGLYVQAEGDVMMDNNFFAGMNGEPEQVEEENEFFSALATVPEEEGKFSDRDDGLHEYNEQNMQSDQFDDVQQRHQQQQQRQVNNLTNHQRMDADHQVANEASFESQLNGANENTLSSNNSNQTKLTTIAENGFEASVLQYIAGKTGLRAGELFSVDEEPSSYNEDGQSRSSSQTQSEPGMMERNEQDDNNNHQTADSMIYEPTYQINEAKSEDRQLDDLQQPAVQAVNDVGGQEINNDDFGLGRKDDMANYELDEDQMLMSPSNANKTSLEQEEYDEQYRDINNLDDLDRRATNHVHAIDGHSKSMLNDIHQQRTIIDYYDDDGGGGGELGAESVHNLAGSNEAKFAQNLANHSDTTNFNQDPRFQVQIQHVDDDDDVNDQASKIAFQLNDVDQQRGSITLQDGRGQQQAYMTQEDGYNNEYDQQQELELQSHLDEDVEHHLDLEPGDEFDQEEPQDDHQVEQAEAQDLPDRQDEFPRHNEMARIRWMTAVHKIVNREVSSLFEEFNLQKLARVYLLLPETCEIQSELSPSWCEILVDEQLVCLSG